MDLYIHIYISKIIDFKHVKNGMFQGNLERKACEFLLENYYTKIVNTNPVLVENDKNRIDH